MANNKTVSIEQIVAKIDNDFNPDNSDWIPRVGAWVIDAMNQLKCLRKAVKCTKLEVHNRIAMSACCPDGDELRVYDKNGCRIDRLTDNRCGMNKCGDGGCISLRGYGDDHASHASHASHNCHTCEPHPHIHVDDCGFEEEHHHHDCCHVAESHTREVIINNHVFPDNDLVWTEHTDSYDYRCMHRVHHASSIPNPRRERNYVVQGNAIELNFDTDYIVIAQLQVETEFSEYFGCDVPKIPDNGILIEAITQWCMYKMLTRGYRHPVMNLTSASPALNPYIAWRQDIERVKRSVLLDKQMPIDDDAWRSAFMIFTFGRKHK